MTFPILPSNSTSGADIYGRSLRFNSADSAYLNRTPSVAGNRKTWTWSGWVKRSAFAPYCFLFSCEPADGTALYFASSGSFIFYNFVGGVRTSQIITNAFYRDISAWYNIVLTWDTTNATSSDRIRVYVNGVRITDFQTALYPAQNTDSAGINTTNVHTLGSYNTGLHVIDGYLTEVNFIDGQALDPSYFGATNATTGQWEPKAYSGSYGTNGFYLNFKNNSTVSALGTDYSGNGNNWTPNNFSVTPGAGNDSMWDYPVNVDDGGNGRGNYCTWNPLKSTKAPTNGNLDFTGASGAFVDSIYGTIGVSTSGKYYFEVTGGFLTGVNRRDINPSVDQATGRIVYHATVGGIYNESTLIQSGLPTATSTDVISVAINLDAGTLAFYKNNVQLGSNVSISATDTWWPFLQNPNIFPGYTNFGQRPFAYTPPSGFKALNTQNLPSPTIAKGNTQFNPVLYTGNGSTQSVTGLAFTPDLVWIKSRSAATDHALYDVIRGAQSRLESNNTDAQVTSDGGLTAFNSGGFSLSTLAQVNTSAATYVAWNWKANGAGVTNTAGTITSTVSANTTAGFSVVTYTGNGVSGATVGHGLGVAPAMIIIKRRNQAGDWWVWRSDLAALSLYNTMKLNTNDAVSSATGLINLVTSSVISIPDNFIINYTGYTVVAYCFAAITGYSAFGSYTGNGSADGPFVYTGFRPAYVLIKMSSSTGNWIALDSKRLGYNADNNPLYPNLADAEATTDLIDILSNGFKIRSTDASVNTSSGTYIYAAFAESPFKYANAR